MVWIKFAHAGGTAIINLEQTYAIARNGSTKIDFIDPTSNGTTYSFSSSAEVDVVLSKLYSIAKVIDIDRLATQG